MTNEDFFNKGLPKWPGLLVVGKPVTKEQAMEIIIRTDSLDFMCNDHTWSRALNQVVYNVDSGDSWHGIRDAIKEQLGIDDWNDQSRYEDERKALVNKIDLYFLENHQIASSWIGGAHGWCDWAGNIGCHNYNIGKWPDIEAVYNEWVTVAEAFPFLDLRSQVMNCEVSQDDVVQEAVVEFIVKDGKVTMEEPEALIAAPVFNTKSVMARFTDPHAERGCSYDQFTRAYNLVKEKYENAQIL